MPLYNNDGSPYQLTGRIQSFDPENPELALFNIWDQEAIAIGGAPVLYYEVKIQVQTIDPIYLEDRGKLWCPVPICLMAIYDPVPSQNNMTVFGIDSPNELMFEFNYQDVIKRVGHPLRVGSRLFTPHRRENWVVVQNNVEEYKLWGQLRLQVMAKKFQESLTTNEGSVMDAKYQPGFPNDGTLADPGVHSFG